MASEPHGAESIARRLRHHAGVGLFMCRLSLQRQLEYPLFLLNWLLMIPLQYLSGMWLLKILIDQFRPLAGWTFGEIAFLYGLALLSHGLQVVFFIPTWNFDLVITDGGFDRMIVRPLSVMFQFLARYVNLIGVIDLIPGVLIFAYGCHATWFNWSPARALWVFAIVIGATLLRAGVFTLLGCIAFWTQRSRQLVPVALEAMHRTSFFPLSIYPRSLQWVFTVAIPLGFLSFYPASFLLEKSSAGSLPAALGVLTPLIGLGTFGLGLLAFHAGLRRYESAGS